MITWLGCLATLIESDLPLPGWLRKNELSGTWYLGTFYLNEKVPHKIDKYTLWYRGLRLSGRIERVYSAEDQEQEGSRRYSLGAFIVMEKLFTASGPTIRPFTATDAAI